MMKVLVSQKSYGGSEVLEIETRIRLIQQHLTSFVFEGHDSDPQIYTQYYSGLNYPRNSFELKIGLAHKSSAQECYESLFVEAYLPISRLTFPFLQNEGKLTRSECLTSIIATLISYCNPIK